MAQIDVSNITSTSFTVRLSGLQGEYAYQRKLKWTAYNISAGYSTTFASKYTYIAAYGTNGGDYTFSNMVPNNEYQVYCTVYGVVNGTDMELTTLISEEFYTKTSGSGGDSGGGGSSTYWTLVNKGSLGTITSQKDISFTIESYKVYRFEFQFAYSGVPKFYTTGNVATYGQWTDTSVVFSEKNGCVDSADDITQNNGGSGNFSIGSAKYPATANTPYWLFVSGVSSSDVGPTTLHIVPPPNPDAPTIAKWDWDASNGSANASVTSAAHYAVKNQQPTKNFSHLVWNDMVDKVVEILEAIDDGWNDTTFGLTVEKTKMTTSDTKLTAERFNSLRYNIGRKYSTGINDVSQGDEVKGEYFTTLADRINGWIDTL